MNPQETIASLLEQQLAYYRARATEYDQWWFRQGRYDRGPEANAQWRADAAALKQALISFGPSGRILELACGTGLWTEQLLPFAAELTALDGAPEMLEMNAARLGPSKVRYLSADLFQWRPIDQFDAIFFGFWLSHVPPERFAEFWALVDSCLAPGGRIFFLDSRYEATSTAKDHTLPDPEASVLLRRLDDGREFHIFKVFYEADNLKSRLAQLGWDFSIRQTDKYFLYGSGQRMLLD